MVGICDGCSFGLRITGCWECLLNYFERFLIRWIFCRFIYFYLFGRACPVLNGLFFYHAIPLIHGFPSFLVMDGLVNNGYLNPRISLHS